MIVFWLKQIPGYQNWSIAAAVTVKITVFSSDCHGTEYIFGPSQCLLYTHTSIWSKKNEAVSRPRSWFGSKPQGQKI